MTRELNYVTVDNPNVPILCPKTVSKTTYGKVIPVNVSDAIDPDVAHVSMFDMYLPNISLRSVEGVFSHDAAFFNKQAQGSDLLGSCVFYKGNVKTKLPDGGLYTESFNRSHNFKFDPNNELKHYTKASSEVHFIHFSYTGDFLGQFLPEHEPWADNLRSRISKRERVIGGQFAPISAAQDQAMRNILQCPLDGKLGYMLIETSIVQVILLQMYMLFNTNEVEKPQAVSKRDLEVINAVKEHLEKKFLDDHSLQSIAREFGTNTNKLMCLFRKAFGQSIFEFINTQRMDHAMMLLRDREMLVTEVARVIGYKNPNHFSSAFKKRFGISPSDVN